MDFLEQLMAEGIHNMLYENGYTDFNKYDISVIYQHDEYLHVYLEKKVYFIISIGVISLEVLHKFKLTYLLKNILNENEIGIINMHVSSDIWFYEDLKFFNCYINIDNPDKIYYIDIPVNYTEEAVLNKLKNEGLIK